MKRFWRNQYTSIVDNITRITCPHCFCVDSLMSYPDTAVRTCSSCMHDFLLSKEYIYLLEEDKHEPYENI